jgi:hypothetical protein
VDEANRRRGHAILATYGYSFSEISHCVFGVFRTSSAAYRWLEKNEAK